jgi:hypothetical protein
MLPSIDTPRDEGQIQEIVKEIGTAVFKSAQVSMESAAKAVVPSVPDMVDEILDDLKSGSVRTFNIALDKLDKLVQKLGIDLKDYSKELANFQTKREEKLIRSEEKLQTLREKNIVATIEKSGEIKVLSKREIETKQSNLRSIEKSIAKEEKLLEKETKLLQESNKLKTNSVKQTRQDIEKRSEYIKELQQKRQDEVEILGQRSEEKPGILQRGREAVGGFVEEYVPTPIAEVGSAFVDGLTAPISAMKDLASTFGGLLKPLKLLKPLFTGIVGALKKLMTAIMASMVSFLPMILIGAAVVAAVLGIIAIFKKLKEYIAESWLGKLFGMDEEGKKKELKDREEGTGKYQNLDEGFDSAIDSHFQSQSALPKVLPENDTKGNMVFASKSKVTAMDTGSIIPTSDSVSKSNNTIVNAPQANNVVNNSTYAGGLTGVRNSDPSIHKSFVNA